MRRDDDLDPGKLKQPNKGGRSSTFTPEMVLKHLPKKKSTTADWQKKVCDETGMSRSQFYTLKKQIDDKVEQDKKGNWKLKKPASPESPETPY